MILTLVFVQNPLNVSMPSMALFAAFRRNTPNNPAVSKIRLHVILVVSNQNYYLHSMNYLKSTFSN
jgi:hypothetical protein